jgi:hypothetical protein
MKKKGLVTAVLSICIIFVVFTNAVYAAPGFCPCTINMVGSGADGVSAIYQLTCTGFSNPAAPKWFISTAASTKQYLAVVLTALSMDKGVWVVVDPALGEWQPIQQHYATP